MKSVDIIALTLLIIGGLNWLLVGAFDFNLVAEIFGEQSGLSRLIYLLVGASAVWTLIDVVPKTVNHREHHVTS